MNQDPDHIQPPSASIPPVARALIGAGGLAIAAAVIGGATLAARHTLPPERSTDGPDFDPMLASEICASERVAPPPSALQAVSRRISGVR